MNTIKLGFLGTGTISAAMIRGLCGAGADYQITVSPRNAEIAAQLQNTFPEKVAIAKDNQSVLDRSDIVFIALRMQVAEDIIRKLTFKPTHKIVTLIATASQETVAQWTGHIAPVFRAVPLPFVEKKQSVTPIYPPDAQLNDLFKVLGGCVAVEKESLFNLFMIAGSYMGVYFHIMQDCNQWLQSQGLSQEQTAPFIAQLFSNLSKEAVDNHDFPSLEREFSTKGGTNELIAKEFEKNGGDRALFDAFNTAFTGMK